MTIDATECVKYADNIVTFNEDDHIHKGYDTTKMLCYQNTNITQQVLIFTDIVLERVAPQW